VIDSKGRGLDCFSQAKAEWLPGKRKAGASSHTSYVVIYGINYTKKYERIKKNLCSETLSGFWRLLCCKGAADLGIAWLDDGVDEIATAVVGKKGALHRIDGDLLKVVQ